MMHPSLLRRLIPLTSALLIAGGAIAQPADGVAPITLDGDLSDWPPEVAAVADGDYLYIKATIDGPERTLQAMQDRTLELWIDADSSAASGAVEASPGAAAGMGVDLEVRFSPRTDGRINNGVAVWVPVAGGERIRLGHADAGVMFLPTYAAPAYEIRLSRHAGAVPGGLAGGVLSGEGVATLMLVVRDASGKVLGWSDPFGVELPGRSAAAPKATDPLPAREEGTLRVMTWNVLKSAPVRSPGPFGRVIRAVDPDILLLQEWAEGDAAAIGAWLTREVGGEWHVIKGGGGDVAIAARFAVEGLTAAEAEGGRTVRFVAGIVSAPAGPVVVGSAHFKCCGYIGSDEDVRRLAEAGTANQTVRAGIVGRTELAMMRVLGGDLNLVGSRPPLDVMRAGLDADGSDLEVIDAMVWGGRAMYTWSDAGNDFSPGRLDYLLVSGASAEVVRSFVVDLSVIAGPALEAMGIESGDVGASDHLPVVADLRPR